MIIIRDTREQCPLEFKHRYVEDMLIQKLEVGDYAVQFSDGYIPPIRFERKSISDLFGTMSSGYKRFKKEMERAIAESLLLVIIIEVDYTKILAGYKHSTRDGQEIADQLFTIMCKYHVPFVCCRNRIEMAKYITDCFISLGKKHIDDVKKAKKLALQKGA